MIYYNMIVWDSKKKEYKGMVDMADIVAMSLSTLSSESSPEAAELKFSSVPVSKVISTYSHQHSRTHTARERERRRESRVKLKGLLI